LNNFSSVPVGKTGLLPVKRFFGNMPCLPPVKPIPYWYNNFPVECFVSRQGKHVLSCANIFTARRGIFLTGISVYPPEGGFPVNNFIFSLGK
jgi:hypothetical protein